MRAKITKWCENQRSKLVDVLTLEKPISLMIEPSSRCKFRCYYCPQGYMEDKIKNIESMNTIMDFSVFEKTIYEAKKFKSKIKTINFSRIGERLLNKKIADMVLAAKKSKVFELIKIITNGSKLSKHDNLELISAGLDVLRISLQGITSEQIYDSCKFKMNFECFIENIKHFYDNRYNCKVFIKISDKIIEGKESEFFKP